jgi:hypothetical protein
MSTAELKEKIIYNLNSLSDFKLQEIESIIDDKEDAWDELPKRIIEGVEKSLEEIRLGKFICKEEFVKKYS